MYLHTGNKTECCGCLACIDACPTTCITKTIDEEGFVYPVINDTSKCVHCNNCVKTCPISNSSAQPFSNQICTYGWHTDTKVRKGSSSGAASVAIMHACSEAGYTKFYGAIYGDNFKVEHCSVDSINDIEVFAESKYCQSDSSNIYRDIKNDIHSGCKVVFIGTPCQVTAISNFLNKVERKKVLGVSLICHGVSSPAIFHKYINETEKLYNAHLTRIKFRDVQKNTNGKMSWNYTSLYFDNGTVKTSNEDLYSLMFGVGMINRPSCFQCPFTNTNRKADITIGDFWGAEDYKSELTEELPFGISVLITHTEKANDLLPAIRNYMKLEDISINQAIGKKQPQLSYPMKEPSNRKRFILKSLSGSFISCAKKEKLLFKAKRFIKSRI